MTREDMVLLIEAEDTINNMNAVFMQLTGFGYADGEFAKLDNVFEVILNNSDQSYSMDEDENMGNRFYNILMNQKLSPGERADMLMEGEEIN